MLIKTLLITLFLVQSLYGESVTIGVAANVSYAIENLVKEFKKLHPNTDITIILGSSGKLTAQIKHGAPYQIFMSANMKYPQNLYDEKIAIIKPRVYANGILTYLSSKKQDYTQGINLLKSKDIKKIAIANPLTAPYGMASMEALKSAGIYEDVKRKLVYSESASSVVVYALRATDIGFVPKSVLFSQKMKKYKEGIHFKEVDKSLYKPIKQGIVILSKGKDNPEAVAFYNFMFTPQARKILDNFGYSLP